MVDDALNKLREELFNDVQNKPIVKVPLKIKGEKVPEKKMTEKPEEEIKIREIEEPKIEIKEKPEEELKEKKIVKTVKKVAKNKPVKKKTTKKMPKKKTAKKIVKKKVARKSKKTKKNFEIKNYIIPIAAFIVILIIALVLKFAVFNDTVVAYVNNSPIYLSDIEERHDLYQGMYSKEDLLNQSIMEEMLLQEAKTKGYTVSDEEFQTMMDQFIASTGLTKEQLDQELKLTGSSYKEFEKSSRERFLINKLLEDELANVEVTEKEIKDYYNGVKAELPEDVTYEDVKDLINQTIVLEKRDNLFLIYIEDLMDKYNIVVFWDLVREKPEEFDSKVELAKCLTENGVKMYSSTTCSACLTQKNMFGQTAVDELEVIECDTTEGKEECTSLAIKATPTWIVNNIKYTGVLSLEGLAELADCVY